MAATMPLKVYARVLLLLLLLPQPVRQVPLSARGKPALVAAGVQRRTQQRVEELHGVAGAGSREAPAGSDVQPWAGF